MVIAKADIGRRFWIKNKLDKYDYVLLLPEKNFVFSSKVLKAFAYKLDNLVDMGRSVKAVVLSFENIPINNLFEQIIITEVEAYAIISLYSMYKFTGKLIIGSFELPHGRKLKNLIDCGIATEEDLVSEVILGGLNDSGII